MIKCIKCNILLKWNSCRLCLIAPDPLGTIAIDSKFPLENYQNMVDKNNSEMVRIKLKSI